jgi:hypothetical protein
MSSAPTVMPQLSDFSQQVEPSPLPKPLPSNNPRTLTLSIRNLHRAELQAQVIDLVRSHTPEARQGIDSPPQPLAQEFQESWRQERCRVLVGRSDKPHQCMPTLRLKILQQTARRSARRVQHLVVPAAARATQSESPPNERKTARSASLTTEHRSR